MNRAMPRILVPIGLVTAAALTAYVALVLLRVSKGATAVEIVIQNGAAISKPLPDVHVFVPRTSMGHESRFGDDNLAVIAPHLSHIRKFAGLRLDGTSVTDAGLARLVEVPELKRLQVCDTSVTAKGLTQLKSLPRLQEVVVSWHQLSDSDIDRLRHKMPGVKVWRAGRAPATATSAPAPRREPG